MIITLEGQFVTARAHPKLVLIQPKVEGSRMTLSAPDRADIVVDIAEIKNESSEKAVIWQQEVDATDAGDQVAEWLSEFVLGIKEGLRLVFYPNAEPTRDIRSKNKSFKKLLNSDAGAMHDLTSYMIINQASMDDLNSRIDHVIKPLQFRPNIVVKGPKPFEEDNWNWIRIGDTAVFRSVKPCTRYVISYAPTCDHVGEFK